MELQSVALIPERNRPSYDAPSIIKRSMIAGSCAPRPFVDRQRLAGQTIE
jgi:hypothetical protein